MDIELMIQPSKPTYKGTCAEMTSPCSPTWRSRQSPRCPGTLPGDAWRISASHWSPLRKCLQVEDIKNIFLNLIISILQRPRLHHPRKKVKGKKGPAERIPSSPSIASISASGTSANIASVNSLVISQFGLSWELVWDGLNWSESGIGLRWSEFVWVGKHN